MLVLALLACTGDSGWLTVSGVPERGYLARYDDVFFLDRVHGWLVNTDGQVYRTEDAGRSWRMEAFEPPIQFRSIGFVSRQVGWAGNLNRFPDAASDSALWETTDGGRTWVNIDDRVSGPRPEGVCGIWVLDESNVFAVGRWPGSAILLRSRDGGLSWISQDLSPMASTLIDVFFHDENHGIVVGGAGFYTQEGSFPVKTPYPIRTVILRTTDGGETWEEVFLGAPQRRSWAWKISFPSELVGYVSVEGSQGVVLKTADGGVTWRQLETGSPHGFQGIGFVSPDTGWASSNRAVYGTTDGGETWSEAPFGSQINRFRFLSGGIGYAAGKTLYRHSRGR